MGKEKSSAVVLITHMVFKRARAHTFNSTEINVTNYVSRGP